MSERKYSYIYIYIYIYISAKKYENRMIHVKDVYENIHGTKLLVL